MSKLDLEWLAVFDAIYTTAHVTRAAERLGMTQGAASTALGKLREHFGDVLFTRTAHGMQPTPYAEQLRPHLSAVMRSLEAAHGSRPTFDAAASSRRFRLCITDISEVVLMPRLITHLQSVAPGVSVETETINADTGIRLSAGTVDLAIGFMPQLEAGFFQQVLFEQRFVCIASAIHPRLANTRRLTATAFAREQHATVQPRGTGHAIVDDTLDRLGVRRQIAVQLSTFLGMARLVAATELIAIVPNALAEILKAQEPLLVFPCPHPLPSYAVKQHWHERFHADPANAWLRRTVAQVMGRETLHAVELAKG